MEIEEIMTDPIETKKEYKPRVTTNKRECIMCEKKLVGRADKVFCSSECKNHYHKQNRVVTKTVTSETWRILQKNYLILSALLDEDTQACIRELATVRSGFEPNFTTGFRVEGNQVILELFDLEFQIKNNCIEFWKTANITRYSPYAFERWRREVGGPTLEPDPEMACAGPTFQMTQGSARRE